MSYLFNKTIYLVSPSFGCSTSPYNLRLKESIKNFKNLGFKIIEGSNIFNNLDPFASTNKIDRAKEINKALNSDASLILSVAGGEVECEILPYIEFEKFKDNKKIFMGFSDDTNLAFTLATISNMKTIYACSASSFFKITDVEKQILDLIEGKTKIVKGFDKYFDIDDKNEYILEKEPFTIKKVIKNINNFQKEKGVLIGGCLDCLISICGTKFDNVKNYIQNKKIIFYLESCDLNPLQVRRGLFQLKESGWFKNNVAFVFGRMQDINHTQEALNYSYSDAILDSLNDLNLPMLLDTDLGHVKPIIPFINNVEAQVSYKNNNILIEY